MKKGLHDVTILGYGVSACFLVIHVFMLFLFQHFRVDPMVYFNIFSILFYIGSFFALKYNRHYEYVVLVYFEVLAHMAAATVFVGVDAGFQITLIGIIILAFYSEYLSISRNLKRVHAAPLSICGMLTYIGSFAYAKTHTPRYPLPDAVCFWLQIAWAVTVFVIAILFLELFVMITTKSEKQLKDLAKHDPLTGLLNRAGYEEMLSRADVHKIVLILIDLDRFKEINDTYGHEKGDMVLKKTANAFREVFRLEDQLCRVGGDEFAVILEASSDVPEDLIREKISHINSVLSDTSDGVPAISISSGVAYGDKADNTDKLFTYADKALYRTKSGGRNGVSFYSPGKN